MAGDITSIFGEQSPGTMTHKDFLRARYGVERAADIGEVALYRVAPEVEQPENLTPSINPDAAPVYGPELP